MKLHNILLALLFCVGLSAGAQGTTFTRNKVLLEKYTGINCGWCPSGDAAVSGYLQRHPEHRDVMVEMRHNAYSTPDRLTVPMHTSLDAVWKPSGFPKYFMDRCAVNGNRSSNVRDYEISWDSFNTASFDPVTKRLNALTNVSLSLEGSTYDPATRQLTIYAHGDVTADLQNLHINAFIVQDLDGYENTSRTFMTEDLNGDPLPLFGSEYKVGFTTKLPEKYGNCATVPADMKVIVFVSSRFATDAQGNNDFTFSEVHNTEVVSITSLPSTSDMPDKCPAPTVNIICGQVVFECSEPDATFSYTIEPVEMETTSNTVSPTGEDSPAFIIKAKAATAQTFPSDEVSQRFTLADILDKTIPDGITEMPAHAETTSGDAAVYTLSGRRVQTPSGTRLTVPGLYIIGGKKVIK